MPAADLTKSHGRSFAKGGVPGLTTDNVRVGVNWNGPRAVGYDLLAQEILRNVEFLIQELQRSQ